MKIQGRERKKFKKKIQEIDKEKERNKILSKI